MHLRDLQKFHEDVYDACIPNLFCTNFFHATFLKMVWGHPIFERTFTYAIRTIKCFKCLLASSQFLIISELREPWLDQKGCRGSEFMNGRWSLDPHHSPGPAPSWSICNLCYQAPVCSDTPPVEKWELHHYSHKWGGWALWPHNQRRKTKWDRVTP